MYNHIEAKVAQHGSQIESLERGQSALFEQQADMRREMTAGFRELTTLISKETKPHPTNWAAWVGTVVALILLGYSHLSVVLRPLEASIRLNNEWITARSEALIRDYKEFGSVITKTDSSYEHVQQLEQSIGEICKRLSYLEGRQDTSHEFITRWILQIDEKGSRANIITAPEAAQQ